MGYNEFGRSLDSELGGMEDMESEKRITLRELTQLTGYSRTTIYNVLNNKGNFSESTRKAILQAMEQYGYRPNLNARNLAKKQPMEIGVLGICHARYPYVERQLRCGVQKARHEFEDHGMRIALSFCEASEGLFAFENEWLREIAQLEEQGIQNFVLFTRRSERIFRRVEELCRRGCSVVLVNGAQACSEALSHIQNDYRQSGRLLGELVRKMMEGGTLQPVLFQRFQGDYPFYLRYCGLCEVLEGLPQFELLPPVYLCDGVPEKIIAETAARRSIDGWVDLVHAASLILEQQKASNSSRRPHLFSVDYYRELAPAMAAGTIDAFVQQELSQNTFLAIQVLFDYLCYHKQPEKQHPGSPMEIVMGENCRYFDR